MNEALLGIGFLLDYCFAYYMILKMEAMYSSETSVDIEQTG
jgi:hypothetical protein